MASEPTEDNPDDGPECPDCGETTDKWVNQLSDDENTVIINCPNCEFDLETMSNLAWKDRDEHWDDEF